MIVSWIPAVAGSKSTVNCPTPFTGALGLPSTSVSFAKTLTVPSAPSSVNGVALWSSSFAIGVLPQGVIETLTIPLTGP